MCGQEKLHLFSSKRPRTTVNLTANEFSNCPQTPTVGSPPPIPPRPKAVTETYGLEEQPSRAPFKMFGFYTSPPVPPRPISKRAWSPIYPKQPPLLQPTPIRPVSVEALGNSNLQLPPSGIRTLAAPSAPTASPPPIFPTGYHDTWTEDDYEREKSNITFGLETYGQGRFITFGMLRKKLLREIVEDERARDG
ncbi:uncharacterized protein L203_100076 [Cryptococcus depauperatus CBS 7841]|uniref:Uncharacterized protein n=1 Tax=Cryptococcus depauperatus CBS 7841 TaxID=1295531 RepID=A0A1E3IZP1_9TREE|nr:hypothetical protein L203_00265 [Cryptococcus depauperatus CBS 7841]